MNTFDISSVNWTIVISLIFAIPIMIVVGNLVRNARSNNSGNPLNDFFRSISDTVNGAETAFLDLLSVLVPYAVPIIPAYLTYRHTKSEMGFDTWVAITAAFVVEVLGTASVATAIRFYRWNQKYKDVNKRAPFWLAVIVYVVYIVITITVNVILEIVAQSHGGWVIFAIALFSLLSFPSSTLISIRTQYHEMLEDLEAKRQARRGGSTPQPEINMNQESIDGVREKHASDYKDQIVKMYDKEYRKTGKIIPLAAISKRFGLNHEKAKGSISAIRNEWMRDNNIPKPTKE